MAVPYTFGTATSSIPLSQLDSNFNTVITLGNTAIQLGNTVTTLNNMTLANVTISSGNVTITNVTITTANVTTANITTAVIGTETVTTSTITSANITTANVTTANITTGNVTTGTVSTSLTLSYGTANAVAYLNGSKVVTTGSALTFDGTNFATTGTATAAKLIPTGTSVTGNGMYLPATNSVGISTNGTNAVYIDASQKVLIGNTTSPSSASMRLLVANPSGDGYAQFANNFSGGGAIGAAGGAGLIFYGYTGAVGSETYTERMRIDSSGNVLVGTSSAATPSSTGYISTANTFGFKNRIINGGMVIDQRNAGASVTVPAATFTYSVDRWAGYGSAASKFTLQQNAGSVSLPSVYTNYLGAVSSSSFSVASYDGFLMGQRIEGYNMADLAWGTANAKTITLSFWAYSTG